MTVLANISMYLKSLEQIDSRDGERAVRAGFDAEIKVSECTYSIGLVYVILECLFKHIFFTYRSYYFSST